MSNISSVNIKSTYDFWVAMNGICEKWAKNKGITSSTVSVLFAVNEQKECCTLLKICERISMPKQTVNAIINNLEKDAMLIREINSNDKRSKYIRFTIKGEKYVKKLLDELHDLEEQALSRMDTEKRKKLLELNEEYLNNLILAMQ